MPRVATSTAHCRRKLGMCTEFSNRRRYCIVEVSKRSASLLSTARATSRRRAASSIMVPGASSRASARSARDFFAILLGQQLGLDQGNMPGDARVERARVDVGKQLHRFGIVVLAVRQGTAHQRQLLPGDLAHERLQYAGIAAAEHEGDGSAHVARVFPGLVPRLAELLGQLRQRLSVGEICRRVAAGDPVLQRPQRANELEGLRRSLLTAHVPCREQGGGGESEAQEKQPLHGVCFRNRISMRRFCAASGSWATLRLRSA